MRTLSEESVQRGKAWEYFVGRFWSTGRKRRSSSALDRTEAAYPISRAHHSAYAIADQAAALDDMGMRHELAIARLLSWPLVTQL